MTVPLPDELRTVVVSHPGVPLEVIDEQNSMSYVLVPADQFERLRSLAEDGLGDSYAAQSEAAGRAGWDDPAMDEYNDYDAHRRTA